VRPTTSDTYGVLVTYSDGTLQTLTAKASVLDAFATNLSPMKTKISTTPTFTWTDPTNASSYVYGFTVYDSNYNTIWQIPSNNSKLSGFPYTITSLKWGVDPTDATNKPTVTSLSGGTTYIWILTAHDSNGNSSRIGVSY